MWVTECGTNPNQISQKPSFLKIEESDLLKMPDGGVTMDGLIHNIRVGILFILNWLNGVGHFIYLGSVEDSATAEISRSQVWQWIKHNVSKFSLLTSLNYVAVFNFLFFLSFKIWISDIYEYLSKILN